MSISFRKSVRLTRNLKVNLYIGKRGPSLSLTAGHRGGPHITVGSHGRVSESVPLGDGVSLRHTGRH
jgi:hypothetical protein